MSKERNLSPDINNTPEYICSVNSRINKSEHKGAVSNFLLEHFHVTSIDELLARRGVYYAAAQIEILLDELEKKTPA